MINKIVTVMVVSLSINILASEQPSGLFNKGNTCYMNAALQCLYNIKPLTDFLLAQKNTQFYKEDETLFINKKIEFENQEITVRVPTIVKTVAYEYMQLVEKLKNSLGKPVDPISFCQKMWPALGNQPGAIGDADEFINVLLERLIDRDIARTPETNFYGFPFNFIPKGMPGELFYGIESSVRTDKRSDQRRPLRKKENALYNKLSIPIIDTPALASSVSLEDCLKNYFSTTDMPDSPNFTKKIELLSLPSYLIIALKRFTGDNFEQLRKINTFVTIPVNSLTMKPYVAANYPEENTLYELVSFVQHGGSMNGGHYNAYIKYNDQWYFCDDSHTSKFDTISVFETNGSFDGYFTPYVLIYKKQDTQIPSSFELTINATQLRQALQAIGISDDLLTAYVIVKKISLESLVDGINQNLITVTQIRNFIMDAETSLRKNIPTITVEMLFALQNELRAIDMIALEKQQGA